MKHTARFTLTRGDYFPGANYFDVAALDVYRSDFKQDYYEGLLKLAVGKPMALAEVGPAPTLAVLNEQPRWAWWMTWAGMVGGRWGGDTNALQALVNAPRSLSLDDAAYRAAIAPLRAASGLSETGPTAIQLGGRTATIRKFDAWPYVESEYTKRFRFDTFTNPKLKELRERYKLDAVIAPGRNEFERQVLLLDWVHHQFKKFGRPATDLTVPADELCKYGFIGYIPNTGLMDAGPDYGRMFIVKDKLCEGTRWHTRTNPANPAVDPYFPINQAALSLAPEQDHVRVALRTMTPNFKRYEARIDGGVWGPSNASFVWSIHAGSNRLELMTVNQFGIDGPISMVEVER